MVFFSHVFCSVSSIPKWYFCHVCVWRHLITIFHTFINSTIRIKSIVVRPLESSTDCWTQFIRICLLCRNQIEFIWMPLSIAFGYRYLTCRMAILNSLIFSFIFISQCCFGNHIWLLHVESERKLKIEYLPVKCHAFSGIYGFCEGSTTCRIPDQCRTSSRTLRELLAHCTF